MEALKMGITGFFVVIGLAIVFVQAGKGELGKSGGEQTGNIIKSAGGALGSLSASLETGTAGSG